MNDNPYYEACLNEFKDFLMERALEQIECPKLQIRYKNFSEIRAAIRNHEGCSMKISGKMSKDAEDAFTAIANFVCSGYKHLTCSDITWAMNQLCGSEDYCERDADWAVHKLMGQRVTLKCPDITVGEYTGWKSEGMLLMAHTLEMTVDGVHHTIVNMNEEIPRAIELAETGTLGDVREMIEWMNVKEKQENDERDSKKEHDGNPESVRDLQR